MQDRIVDSGRIVPLFLTSSWSNTLVSPQHSVDKRLFAFSDVNFEKAQASAGYRTSHAYPADLEPVRLINLGIQLQLKIGALYQAQSKLAATKRLRRECRSEFGSGGLHWG